MPAAVLKTYAEESGKSMKEVEDAWEEAKKSGDKRFKERNGDYWAWVNVVTQRKLGIDQKKKEKEKADRKKRRGR